MSLVNPNDPPIDREYYVRKYGLENNPVIQAKTASTSDAAADLQLAKKLAVATMTNSQKAGAELKQVLKDYLKQPHQDTAEKILELIKENLPLMEILKIKDEVFPSLLTPLQEPTKDGILQVFHPFHKITQSHLSF